MAYGVTSTGFSKKTLAIIKSELESSYRKAFGNGINLRPPSLMATQIGIHADREAAVWDIAEAVFNSRARSTAQGVALDNVNELTAEERLGAQPSKTFNQIFFGTPGTIVPISFVASVAGNASGKFSPQSSVALGAGTNAVQKLAFSAVPDAGTWTITMPDAQVTASLAYNADAAAVQAAIRLLTGWDAVTVTGDYTAGFTVTFVEGLVVGYAGLQPQTALVGNSSLTHTAVAVTITQSHTTVGVAQAVATMQALVAGPTVALAKTLTTIETPVTGLTATKNLDDATVGRNVETDAEYRVRANAELQKNSSATPEAIRIGLKKVLNVTEAIVYQNTTLVTDGNGVPAKAVHCYVEGGTDADVALAIWNLVGGGIETYGSTVVSITDSQGISQTVKFDRAVQKPVYVIVSLTKDATTYPADGDAQVKAAIVAYGSTLKIGDDVLLYPKLLPAIVDNVPGILDLTVKIGFSPAPTLSANLTIGPSEVATFNTSNISVA